MRSLQAKMFIVFALIATLPLLAMSYLALAETRSAVAMEVGSANGDAASAAAGFVDVYVENGRVLLDAQARSPSFGASVNASDRAGILLALQGLRERSAYQGEHIFSGVLLMDDAGELLAAHPPEAADNARDSLHSAAFALARAQGRLTMVPVAHAGEPVLPIAVPVFVDGVLRGVLIADMNLATLSETLRPFAPEPSQVVFVTDARGRLISHPNATVLSERPDWASLEPVQRARATNAGFVEYVDPVTGTSMLGAYATIPRLQWVLVNAVPTGQAYEALTRLTAVLVVLSGTLAGAILLATVVVARRIVAPVKELTDAAEAVAGGTLSKRIQPRGNDEIAHLGHTFNEMANRIGESLDGLRRSEARYRSLVESANDLIFTIQPDGSLNFASPLTRRLVGDEASRPGQVAHAFVHEGDRLVFMDAVNRVLEKGESVLFVPFRLLAHDGTSRVVLTNFSPIFEGDETPARVLAVAHDVTQERRQELVREKSFQMARLVSEEASIDLLTHRGLVLLMAVADLPGGAVFLREGVLLREVATSGSISAGHREGMRDAAERAIDDAQLVQASLDDSDVALVGLPLLEHGEVLGAVVLQSKARLPDEDVEVLGALSSQLAVGIRRSLFEARLKGYAAELESRVKDRTAELERKSDEMESFLYSVSHDLKAPLISIQGYAQGLEEDYAGILEDEGALYLERIRKNATLMESLILDLLEFSRIGRIRDEVDEVDTQALLDDIRARLADRYAAADGGTVHVADDLPSVRGEPRRLAQLFTNLLDNAVKYRHPDRAPHVAVTAERDGDGAVVFHVRDNGRGIPERAQAHLFKLFQRVHTPGLDDPGGTGMGLAIVKRIAQTHGGDVAVASTEGEGTTFHVRLPGA